MDEELMSSLRWFDEEPDLSLGNCYHDYLAEMSECESKSISAQCKRLRSLANILLKGQSQPKRNGSKFRKSGDESCAIGSESFNIPGDSAIPEHYSGWRASKADSNLNRSQWNKLSPNITLNSSAKIQFGQKAEHYLEPDARLKLKLYLGTPSKFDEALEFGFPVLYGSAVPRAPMSPKTRLPLAFRGMSHKSTHTISEKQRTDSSDDLSPADSVRDPYGKSIKIRSLSRPALCCYGDPTRSITSPVIPPTASNVVPAGCPQGWVDSALEFEKRDSLLHSPPGREMTLRLTLTRPELRVEDALPYPEALRHGASNRHMCSVQDFSPDRSLEQDPGSFADINLDHKTVANFRAKENGLRKFLRGKW